MFPNARNEKPTTNFNQDIFFLSQKGADESIVRGDASSSEPFSRLTTWLSGDRRLGAAWETLGGTPYSCASLRSVELEMIF